MSYYDTSYPPDLWAPPPPPPDPATGATAGIPGAWTPAGSAPPDNVANLIAGIPNPVVASPATAWTAGQYVQTATAGTTGRASWNGTAWVGGAAPAEEPLTEPPPEEPPPESVPDEPSEL